MAQIFFVKGASMIVFHQGNMPVSVAATIFGKDACWIRAGIVYGWLPIGKATKGDKLATDLNGPGRINYYISPKLVYELTGYLWNGEEI